MGAPARKSGEIPRVSTKFDLSVENEQAGAGREAEPVSRDQILRRERGQDRFIFPVELTTSRIGNLTRLMYTVLCVITIHTHSNQQIPF